MGVAPPAPGGPPSAPSGLPEFLDRAVAPPPRRPRGHGWAVVAAVGAVVVVIVATLFVTGAFSSPASTGGATPADPTFQTAQRASSAAASGFPGGPWSPLVGSGVALASPDRFDLAPLLSNLTAAGCNVTAAGTAGSIYLPATPATAGPGSAAAWFFVYSGATLVGISFPLLVAVVVNSTAHVLFTASGGVCALAAVGYQSLSNAPTFLDSSGAVAVANASGGAAFLAQYPGATRGWAVYWSRLVADPTWNVTYTDCAPGSGGQPGTIFTAQIDAVTSGVVASSTGAGTCPSSAFAILPGPAGAVPALRGGAATILPRTP